MSTSAFIGVVVNPQDRGRVIEPSLELFNKEIKSDLKKPVFNETVIGEKTEVICIYHHWDSNPSLLGETLLKEFDSYEKSINLMGLGDASSINGSSATFYNSWRSDGEWTYKKPKQYESEQLFEKHCDEAYIYLFKDNQWFVKKCYSNNTEWRMLTEILK